jgi:iduronate 2-sulfatase
MLSIYPTLLELCGLPPYKNNEGVSLVPLMNGKSGKREHVAITTYGKDNHGIRTKNFRYIQYEDGGEEFYDHSNDPNEWHNKADHQIYRKTIQQLRRYLPKQNLPWAEHSSYDFQPYFRNQKLRSVGESKKNK